MRKEVRESALTFVTRKHLGVTTTHHLSALSPQFLVRVILYFCTMVINAIFTSNRANLIPMQILGTWPKGK